MKYVCIKKCFHCGVLRSPGETLETSFSEPHPCFVEEKGYVASKKKSEKEAKTFDELNRIEAAQVLNSGKPSTEKENAALFD